VLEDESPVPEFVGDGSVQVGASPGVAAVDVAKGAPPGHEARPVGGFVIVGQEEVVGVFGYQASGSVGALHAPHLEGVVGQQAAGHRLEGRHVIGGREDGSQRHLGIDDGLLVDPEQVGFHGGGVDAGSGTGAQWHEHHVQRQRFVGDHLQQPRQVVGYGIRRELLSRQEVGRPLLTDEGDLGGLPVGDDGQRRARQLGKLDRVQRPRREDGCLYRFRHIGQRRLVGDRIAGASQGFLLVPVCRLLRALGVEAEALIGSRGEDHLEIAIFAFLQETVDGHQEEVQLFVAQFYGGGRRGLGEAILHLLDRGQYGLRHEGRFTEGEQLGQGFLLRRRQYSIRQLQQFQYIRQQRIGPRRQYLYPEAGGLQAAAHQAVIVVDEDAVEDEGKLGLVEVGQPHLAPPREGPPSPTGPGDDDRKVEGDDGVARQEAGQRHLVRQIHFGIQAAGVEAVVEAWAPHQEAVLGGRAQAGAALAPFGYAVVVNLVGEQVGEQDHRIGRVDRQPVGAGGVGQLVGEFVVVDAVRRHPGNLHRRAVDGFFYDVAGAGALVGGEDEPVAVVRPAEVVAAAAHAETVAGAGPQAGEYPRRSGCKERVAVDGDGRRRAGDRQGGKVDQGVATAGADTGGPARSGGRLGGQRGQGQDAFERHLVVDGVAVDGCPLGAGGGFVDLRGRQFLRRAAIG